MNLGFFILIAIAVIAHPCLDYLVKVVFKDGRTSVHKTLRVILFVVTLVIVIFGLIKEVKASKKAQIKDQETRQYETNLLNRISNLSESNSVMRSQICDLSKSFSDFLLATANKPEVDVDTRVAMLEVRKRLEVGDVCSSDLGTLVSTWSNKLAQAKIERDKRHLKSVEHQESILAPSIDIWDHAIRVFQNKLSSHVKPNGKVTSDYIGIPPKRSLCPGNTEGSTWPGISTNICSIIIEPSTNWICKGYIERGHCSGGCQDRTAQLKLKSNWSEGEVVLIIHVENGTVSYSVTRGDGTTGDSQPISDYKKLIESATDDFLATQAEIIQKPQ